MENNNTESQAATPNEIPAQPNAQVETKTETPPTPIIPEKYELKVGEAFTLGQEYLDSFQAYAKEAKLSNEQAQQILDREAFALSEYSKKQEVEFEGIKNKWIEDAKNDPEIGGDSFKQNVELAQRALEKYSTPQFINELNSSGYGNHPELVRIFARIGKAFSEDKIVSANTNTGNKKSYEEIFYGKL
jgi:hypothetical protein